MLVKVKGGYKIKSHKTGKVYPKVYSKEAGEKRISQMEAHKHMNKGEEITNFVIIQKALDNKHFKVERADDCIWLTDKRGTKLNVIHLVPEQAKKIGKELLGISK